MGARVIRSGRKPSMLMMITLFMAGRGVSVGNGVIVGINVSVGARVCVAVDVELSIGANVTIGVGVKVRVDSWHAISTARSVAYIVKIRVVFIINDCNTGRADRSERCSVR